MGDHLEMKFSELLGQPLKLDRQDELKATKLRDVTHGTRKKKKQPSKRLRSCSGFLDQNIVTWGRNVEGPTIKEKVFTLKQATALEFWPCRFPEVWPLGQVQCSPGHLLRVTLRGPS